MRLGRGALHGYRHAGEDLSGKPFGQLEVDAVGARVLDHERRGHPAHRAAGFNRHAREAPRNRSPQRHRAIGSGTGQRQQALMLGHGCTGLAELGASLVGTRTRNHALARQLIKPRGAGFGQREFGPRTRQFRAILHRLGRADDGERIALAHLLPFDHENPDGGARKGGGDGNARFGRKRDGPRNGSQRQRFRQGRGFGRDVQPFELLCTECAGGGLGFDRRSGLARFIAQPDETANRRREDRCAHACQNIPVHGLAPWRVKLTITCQNDSLLSVFSRTRRWRAAPARQERAGSTCGCCWWRMTANWAGG